MAEDFACALNCIFRNLYGIKLVQP